MMEFSNALKEGGPWAWSPDGTFLAACDSSRLVVRDTKTLMVVTVFSNLDVCNVVEWSRDGRYILCAMYKRGIVQVWDTEDEEWACRITEGPAGLAHCKWAPDGRHILNTAEFNVRISVWSLVNSSGITAALRGPKHADRGMDFSRDGRFLAVAERENCKDFVQIYRCANWAPIKRFAVDTKDLADLKWSPDDRTISVWDSNIEYAFAAYTPEGRRLGRFQAYEEALGIKCVKWSPSGQFVAIGSYDQKARILNHLTWRPIEEYEHPATLPLHKAVVYAEEDLSGAISHSLTTEYSPHAVANSAYKLVTSGESMSLATTRCDPGKANPKMGVGMVEWSHSSSMMFTRNDNVPNALWIWDTKQLALHSVLHQLAPIKCAMWDPKRERIALCTGSRTVFVWSPQGASCVQVPLAGFSVNSLRWNADGSALLLMDRDVYCVAFMSPINEE